MEIERETLEEGKIKVKGYTSGWWGKEIKTLPVNYVGALENRSSSLLSLPMQQTLHQRGFHAKMASQIKLNHG